MLAVTGELMKEGAIVNERRGSGHSTASMDSLTKMNTAMNSGFAGRRKTLKAMKKDFNKNKGIQKISTMDLRKYHTLDNIFEINSYKTISMDCRRRRVHRFGKNLQEAI